MDRFPGSGFAGYLAKLSGRFSPNWRQTTGGVLRSAGGGVLPARVEEAGPRPHERRLFGHGRRHGGALLRGALRHLPRDPLPGGGIPLAPGSLEGTRVRGWVASAPLLAWFGWCLAAYGVHGTLSAAAKATKAAPVRATTAQLAPAKLRNRRSSEHSPDRGGPCSLKIARQKCATRLAPLFLR